jgi:crotonobetainyl-CoA:carnitine CoA-transferase CaiB-like acyl-CoA transferase
MDQPGTTTPPLAGVLVADFSRVLAGPLATMTLGDLGARVIKVESPSGDDTRSWGPPFSATGSTYFEGVNRNKESMTLDLADAADLELARTLVARADVVIENFRPGGMAAFGLSYEAVSAVNPRVVYVSISGFGSAAGSGMLGYDFMVQAMGGLMHITGEADGDPQKVGVAVVDVLTAKDAVAGILAALYARDRSGRGARIEVNLLSSLQGALANQAQAVLGAGAEPRRLGNVHPSISPYEALRCSDGLLAVACGNDGQFARLTACLGVPELASDPRFVSNPERVRHRAELVPELERALAGRTSAEWEEVLTAAKVPAGRVRTIAEGLELAERLGLSPTVGVVDAEGTETGRQVRSPLQWEPSFEAPRSAPPALGQHDRALREWLGGR